MYQWEETEFFLGSSQALCGYVYVRACMRACVCVVSLTRVRELLSYFLCNSATELSQLTLYTHFTHSCGGPRRATIVREELNNTNYSTYLS